MLILDISKKENERRLLLGITVSLLYLTLSLACDPLAFRLVELHGLIIGGSAFLFAALYPLLDILTRMWGRNTVIKLIFIFHACDFLYTYSLYLINLLPAPDSFHSLPAFITVITPLPRMFWAGLLGAVVAGIIEVLIFSCLQQKIKNFFLSTSVATIIILLGHNLPTEYLAFHKIFPNTYPEILTMNFLIGVMVLFATATLGNFLLTRILKVRHDS